MERQSVVSEWTSLTRTQNLKVLKKLPERFPDLLPEDDAVQLGAL